MRQRLPGDEACLDLAHVMLIEEVDNWMSIEIFWFCFGLVVWSGWLVVVEEGLLRLVGWSG